MRRVNRNRDGYGIWPDRRTRHAVLGDCPSTLSAEDDQNRVSWLCTLDDGHEGTHLAAVGRLDFVGAEWDDER